jgi:glycosyltransferase involved in cell wall biosynthesis
MILISGNGIRKKLNVAEEDCLVSLFSHYSPHKGQDLFIQWIAELNSQAKNYPFKFLMIGFSHKKQIDLMLSKIEIKGLDRRNFLIGHHDLKPFYKASDIFVMNSQGLGETLGVSQLKPWHLAYPSWQQGQEERVKLLRKRAPDCSIRPGKKGKLIF